MFDFASSEIDIETEVDSSYLGTAIVQSKQTLMERFGACRSSGCSCSSFAYSNDAQFCDNCGQSRSQHIS